MTHWGGNMAPLLVATLMEHLLCDEVGRISNADILAIYPFNIVPIFVGTAGTWYRSLLRVNTYIITAPLRQRANRLRG